MGFEILPFVWGKEKLYKEVKQEKYTNPELCPDEFRLGVKRFIMECVD